MSEAFIRGMLIGAPRWPWRCLSFITSSSGSHEKARRRLLHGGLLRLGMRRSDQALQPISSFRKPTTVTDAG